MNLTRDILHNRHRLSHQQIDGLLDENKSAGMIAEKMAKMEALRSFHDITSSLREREIWFVVLKGPLLSERIYGDPTYRLMKDFDILVKPESVNDLVGILSKMNFEPDYFPWPSSKKKQRLAQVYMNQFGMYNPATGVMTEIHWRLFGHPPAPDEKVMQLLEQNLEEFSFAGKPFFRFTIEFELLYLIVHGSIHAWFRLKWLLDVHEILERFSIDEARFLRLAEQTGTGRFADVCNAMLSEYFPDGKRVPAPGNSNAGWLGEYAVSECKRGSVRDKHSSPSSLASFAARSSRAWKTMRYKMALSSRFRYKKDVLRVINFCKFDLQYSWLPPYAVCFWIFRPFGYLYRSAKAKFTREAQT